MINRSNKKRHLLTYKLITVFLLIGTFINVGCMKRDLSNKDIPTIIISTITVNTPEATERISEAFSEITREKVGCNVKIVGYRLDKYDNEIMTAYQMNRLPDLFSAFQLSEFEHLVQVGAVKDMSTLLEPYRNSLDQYINEKEWTLTSINGGIYGIPSTNSESKSLGFVFRKDIAEELDIDWRRIRTLDDLHDMLLKVQAGYPDMDIIVSHLGKIIPRLDVDPLTNSIGVLINPAEGNTRIENIFESQYFLDLCVRMNQWNDEGLFMDKAYSAKETRQNYFATGNAFGSFTNLSEVTVYNIERYTSYDMVAVQLSPRIVSSDNSNMVWCLDQDSQNSEMAINVLNLMFTDPEVSTLLSHGEKGIDYDLDEEQGFIDISESEIGKDIWLASEWSWPVGIDVRLKNSSNQEDDLDTEFWDSRINESPAMGFIFDSTKVSVEVDACTAVIDKYLNPLLCGELQPIIALVSFNQELVEAGIGKVILEKQEQLDKFLLDKENEMNINK